MRRKQRFGLFLMLMSITACAPVVYDATHYERRTPSHVVVRSTYSQPSHHHHKPAYQQIHPIEVTLYADNTYLSVYFKPIHLVIADGEYVKIPIRNRRGRQTIIYAHYHKRNLHFDTDRNCRNLHGSSRYKYDKRWVKGHNYTHINAGKNYNLTGFKLRIRNVPPGRHQAKKNKRTKVINKNVIVRNNNGKKPIKHKVTKVLLKDGSEKSIIRDRRRAIDRRSTKDSDYYVKIKQTNKAKSLITKEKSPIKVIKKTKRPVILEKISRHDQSKHVRHIKPRSANKSLRGDISTKKRTVKVILAGGTVTVDGKRGKFRKASLVLKEGESRNVILVTRGGVKVSVPIAYRNGALKVASSGGQFRSDPAWSKGKTYRIHTKGSSRLNDVKLTIVAH